MKPGVGNYWGLWLAERDFFYKMCMRWLRGNHHDTEDVLGKGAINGYEFIVTHPAAVDRFRPWMLKILHNLSFDVLRSRSRTTGLEVLGSTEDDPVDAIVCLAEAPDHTILRGELARSIGQAAADLPPKLHEVFTLRFVDELPYDAISNALKISQTNARKRIQLVRKQLRRELRGFAGRGDLRRGRPRRGADRAHEPAA